MISEHNEITLKGLLYKIILNANSNNNFQKSRHKGLTGQHDDLTNQYLWESSKL